MIRSDGTVKVLDFGLAMNAPDVAAPSTGASSTLTGAGIIVGTPAYMSPEQARGHRVDRRTDLWAFGCVLFELLSGRRAFEGPTASDVMVAVLEHDPDWSRLPSSTPAPLQAAARQMSGEGSAAAAARHGRRAAGSRRRRQRRRRRPGRGCRRTQTGPVARGGRRLWRRPDRTGRMECVARRQCPARCRAHAVHVVVSGRRADERHWRHRRRAGGAVSRRFTHRLSDAARAGHPGPGSARRDVHRPARRERQLAVLFAGQPVDCLHDVRVHDPQGRGERRRLRTGHRYGECGHRRVGRHRHRLRRSARTVPRAEQRRARGRGAAPPRPGRAGDVSRGASRRARRTLYRHRHAVEHAGRRRRRSLIANRCRRSGDRGAAAARARRRTPALPAQRSSGIRIRSDDACRRLQSRHAERPRHARRGHDRRGIGLLRGVANRHDHLPARRLHRKPGHHRVGQSRRPRGAAWHADHELHLPTPLSGRAARGARRGRAQPRHLCVGSSRGASSSG